jgi:hypothetical protein
MTNFDPIDNTDDDELAVNQSLDALFEEASTPTKKKDTNEISCFNNNLLSTSRYCGEQSSKSMSSY